MNICIIGAGWYGCHSAYYLLKKGYTNIIIMDKEKDFFSGSSSKNQNRLHLGYHYPRSKETIDECKKGYSKFLSNYSDFVSDVPLNLYIIHNKSNVSFEQYTTIFPKLNDSIIRLEEVFHLNINNVNQNAFNVSEKFINNEKAKAFFKQHLGNYFQHTESIHISEEEMSVNGIKYDYILNCTNNQYIPIPLEILKPVYEVFYSLLYKIDFEITTGITIMDGKFFSIYPYDIENKLYTITHVVYGVISKDIITIEERKALIEKDVLEIIPQLKNIAEYKGYFVSNKTKYDYVNDDRSIKIFKKNKYYSFSGGKITGIFEIEPILDSLV